LLPRDIELVLLGEDTYTFESVEYKVYLYQVKLPEGPPYKPTELNLTFDLIEPEKMINLLTIQKELISNLPNKIQMDNSDISNEINDKINDKIDDIDLNLDNYSLNVIKYVCRKDRYLSICEYILYNLSEINELVIDNHLETPEYEGYYNNIIDSISESMKTN
jgi:hypothetical protein